MIEDCFLLAGGLSRRFGEDKLLYRIGEKTVIELTLGALRQICNRIWVVTKEREKFLFLRGVEVVQDVIEKQYAMAGLYTALSLLRGEKALVISGDMPAIKQEVLTALWQRSSPLVTLFRVRDRLYPLMAVYYREALPKLEDYIRSGREKLTEFVLSLPHSVIDEHAVLNCDPELHSFVNMNTKEDVERIIKIYGRKGN